MLCQALRGGSGRQDRKVHCQRLISSYEQAAETNLDMAKDHRKMAEEMKQTLTMTGDGVNDAPALTQVFLSSIRTSVIPHVCRRREGDESSVYRQQSLRLNCIQLCNESGQES
jgi:hypothetical protein